MGQKTYTSDICFKYTQYNSVPHERLTAGRVVQSHMTTAADQSRQLPSTSTNQLLVQTKNATGCCFWLPTAVPTVVRLNNYNYMHTTVSI